MNSLAETRTKTGSKGRGRAATAITLVALASLMFASGLAPSASAVIKENHVLFTPGSASVGSLHVGKETLVDNHGTIHWKNLDVEAHRPFKSGCFVGPVIEPNGEWVMAINYDLDHDILRIGNDVCHRYVYEVLDSGDVVFAYTCREHPQMYGKIHVDFDGKVA
jgi:hypothetical protein